MLKENWMKCFDTNMTRGGLDGNMEGADKDQA